jgi:predicted PurR-regulated permease PerM
MTQSSPTPDSTVHGDDEEHLGLDLSAGSERGSSARKLKHLNVVFLGILVVLAVFYTLYFTRAVAFPIALSCIVAMPLMPVIRRLGKLGIPAPVASALLVTAVGLVLLIGVLVLWAPANQWIKNSPKHFAAIEAKMKSMQSSFDDFRKAGEKVDEIAGGGDGDPATLKVEVKQPSLSGSVLTSTGTFLATATIVVTLVFLFLGFGDGLVDGIVKIMPTSRDKGNLRHMFHEAEVTISNYLFTYTLINIGLGVVIGTGLAFMGVPNPLLWGVMAACLNYLPFVGLIVGSIVVFLVALITFDSTLYALLAPTIYLLANGIEANIVTPVLLGRSLRLNVVAIFLSIILWGWMWGIGGALIAVPLLAVIKVTCDYSRPLKPISQLLES